MPEVLDGEYLIEVLNELGIVKATFSGSAPISDTDIVAYKINTGVELTYWDSFVLKRLSAIYSSMSVKAKNKHCLAPFMSEREIDAQKRKEIANARLEWARSRNKNRM